MKSKRRAIEHTVANKYRVEKLLGEGGFCIVMQAREIETNKIVAIKRMDKSKPVYEKFKSKEGMETMNNLIWREINVMKALNHTNIMRIIESIESNDNIYIVLEFAKGGELYKKIMHKGRFTEHESIGIIYQICAGILYMHGCGYVHRDIKAENILFDEKTSRSRVIITDFGLSRSIKDLMYTNCGTLVYSAPELLLNKTTKGGYTYKIDTWAIGVLVFFMLTGKLPFPMKAGGEQETKNLIISGKIPTSKPYWRRLSNPCKDFIGALLNTDPSLRIELNNAIEHEWIKPFNKSLQDNNKYDIFPNMEVNLKSTLAVVRWRILFYLLLFVVVLDIKYKIAKVQCVTKNLTDEKVKTIKSTFPDNFPMEHAGYFGAMPALPQKIQTPTNLTSIIKNTQQNSGETRPHKHSVEIHDPSYFPSPPPNKTLSDTMSPQSQKNQINVPPPQPQEDQINVPPPQSQEDQKIPHRQPPKSRENLRKSFPRPSDPRENPRISFPQTLNPRENRRTSIPQTSEPRENPRISFPQTLNPRENRRISIPQTSNPRENPRMSYPQSSNTREKRKSFPAQYLRRQVPSTTPPSLHIAPHTNLLDQNRNTIKMHINQQPTQNQYFGATHHTNIATPKMTSRVNFSTTKPTSLLREPNDINRNKLKRKY